MSDETFNSTERFREGETAQGVDERFDPCNAALELQTEHRAKSVLLPARDFIAGMADETGIVSPANSRMIDDCVNDGSRVSTVHIHTRVQRSQPTQREKTVERGAGDAKTVSPPGELFAERSIGGHDRSADNVAVAGQVLGC